MTMTISVLYSVSHSVPLMNRNLSLSSLFCCCPVFFHGFPLYRIPLLKQPHCTDWDCWFFPPPLPSPPDSIKLCCFTSSRNHHLQLDQDMLRIQWPVVSEWFRFSIPSIHRRKSYVAEKRLRKCILIADKTKCLINNFYLIPNVHNGVEHRRREEQEQHGMGQDRTTYCVQSVWIVDFL